MESDPTSKQPTNPSLPQRPNESSQKELSTRRSFRQKWPSESPIFCAVQTPGKKVVELVLEREAKVIEWAAKETAALYIQFDRPWPPTPEQWERKLEWARGLWEKEAAARSRTWTQEYEKHYPGG